MPRTRFAGRVVIDPGVNVTYGDEPRIVAALRRLSANIGKTIFVISGYRTPAHSVAVGGFADDPHTKGIAADIGIGAPIRSTASSVSALQLRRAGLYRPFGGAAEINHVQLLGGRSRAGNGGSSGAPPATSLGSFVATAYGPPWGGIEGGGTTARGTKLPGGPTGRVGPPYIVAVDPQVIPLGTRLKIWPNPAHNPNVVWLADDTGGAIKGNRIDFLVLTGRAAQNTWGRTPVTVYRADGSTPTPNVGTPGGGGKTRPGGTPDGAAVDALFTGYQAERDSWSNPSFRSQDVLFGIPGTGGPGLSLPNPLHWFKDASDAINSVTDFLKALAWITLPRNWLRMFEVFIGLVLFLFGLHASFQAIGEEREGYTTGELALTRSGLGRVINTAARTAVPESRATRAYTATRKKIGTAPHRTRRTALRVRYGREEKIAEQKKVTGNDIPRPRKRRAKAA